MAATNEWQYIDKSEGDKYLFEVIPPASLNKTPPTTLFKYYALNCNSVDSLKNSYLYAPDFRQLNDPYDCLHQLVEYSQEDHKRLNDLFDNEWKEKHEGKGLSGDQGSKIFHYQKFNFFGIISMTTQPDNTLMWAHYAQNKGFAIELDYKKFDREVFLGPFPINYTNCFEPLKASNNTFNDIFLRQTNIKSDVWDYEDEWRFLAHKKTPMHIPGIGEKDDVKTHRKFTHKDCLKSITLGINYFNLEQSSDKQNNQVKLTGLELCVVEFALQNKIDLFWIISPLFHFNPEKNFNLQRHKISLTPIDENNFTLFIHE